MKRVALVVALCCGLAAPAAGHSWYDRDCCDDRDCRPATPQEVKVTPEGFLVTVTLFGKTESKFFPKNDPKVRMSQDGRFHVCVANYGTAVFSWYCLYVPGGGV